MGQHLYTPMYIGQPYTEIRGTDGEEQYYNALYLLGYNSITAKNFCLGTSQIASNSENVEDGKITIDSTQKYGVVQYKPELEIRNSGEVELYSQKVYQEDLTLELENVKDENGYEWVFIANRFSQKYPQKVQIEFSLNGLYDSASGNLANRMVAIAIEYSKDGGNTWLPFGKIGLQHYKEDGTEKTEEQSNISYYEDGSKTVTINGESCTVGYVNTEDEGSRLTYNGVSVITRAKNKQMRFVAEREFSYDDVLDTDGNCILTNGVIEIRVVRTNPQADENTSGIAETIEMTAIRTWCFDKTASVKAGSLVGQAPMIEKDRVRTTRLGFRVQADSDLTGQLDSLNCIVTSKGRVWDKENKVWKTDSDGNPVYEETQNPASIALLALQSPMRGKYVYDDSKIDLDSFGEFYEWCAEKGYYKNYPDLERFQCNGVLTSQKKTSEVLNNILSCGRSYLVLKGKKYGVLIDKPRSEPVLILNSQNVIEASNKKTFDELPDGYSVKFVNEDNGYTEDENVILADYSSHSVEDANLETESQSLLWQTNWQQVWSNARYQLACAKLRPEIWNRKVATEGNLLELGDLVEVQDDTILVGIGEGAEIKEIVIEENYITQIITDGKFTIDDETAEYGVKIIQADGVNVPKVRTAKVVNNGVGEYSTFTFADAISLDETFLPSQGDIVSFGLYEKETISAIVFGKSPDGEGHFDLTLIPYAEGVYEADKTETLPEFDSKVTVPKESYVSNQTDEIDNIKQSLVTNEMKVVKKTVALQSEIKALPVSFRIDRSANTLVFHKTATDKANYEETSVTFTVFINNEIILPDNVNINLDNAVGVSASGTLNEETKVYTLKVNSTYGGTLPEGFIQVEFTYNDILYTSSLSIETSSDVYYLGGLKQSEIPTSAAIGSYFTYLGNDTEEETTFLEACVYILEQTLDEEGNVKTVWVLDETKEHNMTALSDIVSCTELSGNASVQQLVERLVANKAFINQLNVAEITLEDTGFIQSENYEEAAAGVSGSGFRLEGITGTAFLNTLKVNGLRLIGDIANNFAIARTSIKPLTGNQNFSYLGLERNTTGSNNIALGEETLLYNTTGSNNIAIGKSALNSNKEGSNNIAIGTNSLQSIGSNNIALGENSGSLRSGVGNINLGYEVTSGSGSKNIFLGYNTGHSDSAGSNNIILGENAFCSPSSGSYNIALGDNSLQNTSTGAANIAIGVGALKSNKTGSSNIAIGNNAISILNNGITNQCIGIGVAALAYQNSSVTSNIGIGHYALCAAEGNYNTALGEAALGCLVYTSSGPLVHLSGNKNIGIGYHACVSTSLRGDANIFIGAETNVSDESASNQINIGNRFLVDSTGLAYISTDLTDPWNNKDHILTSSSQKSINMSVSSETLTITTT